jgi:hypothetical protein
MLAVRRAMVKHLAGHWKILEGKSSRVIPKM